MLRSAATRLAADRHEPLLGALAARAQHALLEVDVRELQADRLRGAQAARVHELQQRAVAQRAGLGPLRLASSRVDLSAREHARQALRLRGPRSSAVGIVLDRALATQVAVERAQASHLARSVAAATG